jgi:hypothetical protein
MTEFPIVVAFRAAHAPVLIEAFCLARVVSPALEARKGPT